MAKEEMSYNVSAFLPHHHFFTGSGGEKTRMLFEKLLRSLQQVKFSPSALRGVMFFVFCQRGLACTLALSRICLPA